MNAAHGGAGGSAYAPRSTLPPLTNRGAENTSNRNVVEQIQVGLHTSTLIAKVPTDYAMGILLHLLYGDRDDQPNSYHFKKHPHGGRGYKQLWFGPMGIKVYGDPYVMTANGSTHSCIEIPGSAMEQIPATEFRDWLIMNREYIDVSASRLDFFADHCPFTPVQLHEAALGGDIRTRVKRLDAEGNPRNWCKLEISPTGDTFNLGSRDSQRYLRCYNKRGFTRLEIEFSGERAELLLDALVAAEVADWPELYIAWLRDFVDFVDSSMDSNLNRCQPLNWWEEFIGAIPKAGVRLSQVVDTLQKSKEWIEKQVTTTLSMLLEASSDVNGFWEWLYYSVEGGKSRYRAKHRTLLASVMHKTLASPC